MFIRRKMPGNQLAPPWLLDQFSIVRGVGEINNTFSEPLPGQKRTIVDTGNYLTIDSRGRLVVSGGTGTLGDPKHSYLTGPVWPKVRKPGMVLSCTVATTTNGATDDWYIGWSYSTYAWPMVLAYRLSAYNFHGNVASVNITHAFHPDTNTPYRLWMILRATGGFLFHQAPGDLNPVLDVVHDAGTTTPVYPQFSGKVGSLIVDDMLAQPTLWLPTPLASDGFGGAALTTTDGLGHAEGVTGGLGAGGGGLPWTQQIGTWGEAAGVANCSVLASGLGIATVPTGSEDGTFIVYPTSSAGIFGLVLRYADVDNYLYAYYNNTSGKVGVISRASGVETDVIAAATATYAAGAPLMVMLDRTAITLTYNHTWKGAVSVVPYSSASAHGLYTNDTTPTFDNFQAWARR